MSVEGEDEDEAHKALAVDMAHEEEVVGVARHEVNPKHMSMSVSPSSTSVSVRRTLFL